MIDRVLEKSSIEKSTSEVIINILKEENVNFLFYYPGGKSIGLLDSMRSNPEITPILVRQVPSAAFMAYAYSKLTGEPSVCHATSGPGAHYLVPGIAEAWTACLPVIAFCPAVPQKSEGKGMVQESPSQVSLFTPFTKWSARISLPERVPWFFQRAFQIATTGKPGPVFLEIPGDVLKAKIMNPKYCPSVRPCRTRGDPNKIKDAIDLILKSERPVILAGAGIYLSNAFQELREFAEFLGIPVLTSRSGKGSIPEDHPLFAGMVGLYRTKVSKKVWSESDLVISIGCRFEEAESAEWMWLPDNAQMIQVDIDANEIGRNWTPKVAVVGDAKLVLRDLIKVTSERIKKRDFNKSSRIQQLLKTKKEYYDSLEHVIRSKSTPIHPLVIIKEMRRVFNRKAILCQEDGLLDNWAHPHFPVLEAGASVTPAGHTCMGLGVAGAIGAKLAKPERQVVCVTGDGAFQMFTGELSTAVQYNAPVTWCVMNNFCLGWIKYDEELAYGRYSGVDFEVQPDFVKIAEAHQCYGERVEKPRQVREALKSAVKANAEGLPAVLDFIVKPLEVTEGFVEFHEKRTH